MELDFFCPFHQSPSYLSLNRCGMSRGVIREVCQQETSGILPLCRSLFRGKQHQNDSQNNQIESTVGEDTFFNSAACLKD